MGGLSGSSKKNCNFIYTLCAHKNDHNSRHVAQKTQRTLQILTMDAGGRHITNIFVRIALSIQICEACLSHCLC